MVPGSSRDPAGCADMSSSNFCIMTERQVGIGSAAAALEPYLRDRPGVEWTDVTYVEAGGLLERLPLPARARGTLRGYLQTRAALRRRHYDALFFLTHNPAVLQPGALRRTPTVLWTDVTPALLDEQAEQYAHAVSKSAALGAAKRAAVRHCFQHAALCVGWSDWARRSFVKDYGVAEERTAVVAPGVDLARWRVPEREPATLPRLLFVGGDFQRKGGDLLLDVFRQKLKGRCHLDLVTRDAVPEEDGVSVFRGLTAGSPALLERYRQASIFVLPTRGDCFSIASMEAMATGLPVVVSDVGGISELIAPGKSGFLTQPGDGTALATALEQLIADPERARAFGRAGRADVEQRFSAEKTAEALWSLLERAAFARPHVGDHA
jgi:glycosyltransferase involved in cell wall biosynthesis